ncbi:MAG TPA: preprotein translocase subunit SecE [Bacteroidia bacterium]|jgi:preprotein translocase subunit SecE|nr:preprotein translocase subunit SecE [Bacteroidia bacterium]
MSSFSTFIKESYNELVNKVSWPTWSELQESSVIVLVSSIIIALLVFAMDSAFSKIMELIYQLVNSL